MAAGSGERLGAGIPKALVELAGRPLLDWSLAAFAAATSVERVVVAAPAGGEGEMERAGVDVVTGGASRSESVAAALEHAGKAEFVVVHDAARPLVTPELIDQCVAELVREPELAGVVAAAPVADTIKEAGGDGTVLRTLDRSALWSVQTPQAFRADRLRAAIDSHRDRLATATDDATLLEWSGERVRVVPSSPENIKITTTLDLELAALRLR